MNAQRNGTLDVPQIVPIKEEPNRLLSSKLWEKMFISLCILGLMWVICVEAFIVVPSQQKILNELQSDRNKQLDESDKDTKRLKMINDMHQMEINQKAKIILEQNKKLKQLDVEARR